MHPVFFRLGSLEIHTYGVFVAAGFLFGILNAAYRAKTEGIEPERINDLGIWLMIAGILGGKLFHILFFRQDFIAAWRATGLASLREGFVFFGGFIAACLALRRKGRTRSAAGQTTVGEPPRGACPAAHAFHVTDSR